MEILDWISNWFSSECNGDWEHENQIKIETVSNPGWHVTIDLTDTFLEDVHIDNGTIEKSGDDWYFFVIKDKQFRASGDLTKLPFLLNKFREIVEGNITQSPGSAE
jgi:hypothetical protein